MTLRGTAKVRLGTFAPLVEVTGTRIERRPYTSKDGSEKWRMSLVLELACGHVEIADARARRAPPKRSRCTACPGSLESPSLRASIAGRGAT